jgi:hypothetical protein
MAQSYMGLPPFLAVQEAAQWDLRSFFYVYPFVVLFVFLFFVVVPSCKFSVAPAIILFGVLSPSFRA